MPFSGGAFDPTPAKQIVVPAISHSYVAFEYNVTDGEHRMRHPPLGHDGEAPRSQTEHGAPTEQTRKLRGGMVSCSAKCSRKKWRDERGPPADGGCQNMRWDGNVWDTFANVCFPGTECYAAAMLSRAGTIAENNVRVGASTMAKIDEAAAGIVAFPAIGAWAARNPFGVVQCIAGGISATQGPVPPGTTGPAGAVCGGIVKFNRWLWGGAAGQQ